MKDKKKQTVAVAMVTTLGVIGVINPIVSYAQAKESAIANTQVSKMDVLQGSKHDGFIDESTEEEIQSVKFGSTIHKNMANKQGQTDHNSKNLMLAESVEDAFKTQKEAVEAIINALHTYEFSNETTLQEIIDYLNQEFVASGRLRRIDINLFNKIDATTEKEGIQEIEFIPSLIDEGEGSPQSCYQSFTFPRLPKEGEVAINKANFPDQEFRKYVKSNFDNGDSILTQEEISKSTYINVVRRKDISSLKGIEFFPMLEHLYCNDSSIESLNISNNTALIKLNCSNTKIKELDVSNNTLLTDLNCYHTEIKQLNLDNNTVLRTLDCDNTPLEKLDVSKNLALRFLNCYKTEITELDVSNNLELSDLGCHNTKITSLDVSKNKKISYLHCYNTPLRWLNIGTDNQLENGQLFSEFLCSDSNIDMQITGETFGLAEAFPGIDISKVEILSGATLKGSIVSNYTGNNPIVYEYDSGKTIKKPVKLKVIVNLIKMESKIEITDRQIIEFTGDPCSNPYVRSQGSTGKVFFTYENWNGTTWESLTRNPINAGKYRVQAHLTEDNLYKGAESEKIEFTISQAMNYWTESLAMNDWIYGEKANTPVAEAKFGDVIYTYSREADGIYTSDVPTEAGTWYVKAVVSETENYKGLESDPVSFQIAKAIPSYTVPTDLIAGYGQTLKDVVLPEGFAWTDETQSVGKAGTHTFKAIFTPADINNYKIISDIDIPVTVSQTVNIWTDELTIQGWTYGEKANTPVASAKFGTVTYVYSNASDGTYTSKVPENAGTWYVKATVNETENYAGLESDPISFQIDKAIPPYTIPTGIKATYGQTLKDVKLPEGFAWADESQSVGNAGTNTFKVNFTPADTNNYEIVSDIDITVTVGQAVNNWTETLTISGWTYGEKANTPAASAKYGNVVFTYCNKKDGIFTSNAPKEAGTWYMKASVAVSEEYTGLNEIVAFTIHKAVPEYSVPKAEAVYGQTLKDVVLPEGFSWADAAQSVGNASTGIFKAAYTPTDTNNYEIVSDIDIAVTIEKAPNIWIEELMIQGWRYGEQANTPTAKTKYGEVTYTYSSAKDGIFTDEVPTEAGTWYVKARVAGTDNYIELETVKEFTIAPRSIEDITISEITSDQDMENLIVKDLNKELVKGKDYDVTVKQDGQKVTVMITFKGNYTGTFERSYEKKVNTVPVATGDETAMGLWGSILALSAGFIALLIGKKRKKNQ